MARIFTVDFEYEGGRHAALVAVRKTETQPEFFEVSLRDEAFGFLVPEGVVCFRTGDDATAQLTPARAELVHCLKRAVNRYLAGTAM